ncbi:hypothetical protein [Winogradskyella epiphytica]|uniref:hypothetical protein n=1 Tax=Winogradskyella epiphytica TaxID=262005 RepID=UPI0011B6060C|nr:hypothetical protein [Winogradskyella epiphytica]
MKLIFIKIFLFFSIISYSQIDSSFEEIQKRFGKENIEELQTHNMHFEVKRLKGNETIKFTYNREKIVKIIEIQSTQPISHKRLHEIAKELIPNFSLTTTGKNENSNFYYDSNNKFLNIEVFDTNKKVNRNKVIYISDPELINELIPEIEIWN